MKTVFVFLYAMVGVLAAKNIIMVVVEELMLHHIQHACQADPATSVDHELLRNLEANIDNPQVGAHMLCESVGVGLQKANGDLNLKMINDKIGLTVRDPERANFLVDECAVTKNTKEKTAINLILCLDKNGVSYFQEF